PLRVNVRAVDDRHVRRGGVQDAQREEVEERGSAAFPTPRAFLGLSNHFAHFDLFDGYSRWRWLVANHGQDLLGLLLCLEHDHGVAVRAVSARGPIALHESRRLTDTRDDLILQRFPRGVRLTGRYTNMNDNGKHADVPVFLLVALRGGGWRGDYRV